jgi:ketosteroid isomerase-like protein
MSPENVEIVREALERFNQDFNADKLDLSLFAPDVVLDNSNAVFEGSVYHGHDGVREWLSWTRGMWKRQEIQGRDFIPAGEDQVVVPVRLVSVGRDDVEVVAHVAAVMTVREGKITHLKTFQSKSDALEAVRLRE